MTSDQTLLFGLFGVVLALLIWGRIRYDLVAFGALVVAVLLGLVPKEEAFSGFGHPAVIIIALVLIVSRGLINSGAIEIVARHTVSVGRSISTHIAIMAGVGGLLSSFMNNVGALALLMPVDLQTAAKAGRSPALTLMPLSFATILGGLVTLIGTPPNIIIASFRERAMGAPFHMFDYTPVGLVAAVVGILFVAFIGWRLIPTARAEHDTAKELFEMKDYVAELRVAQGSKIIGKRVRELDDAAVEADASILGLIRRGRRLPGQARLETIRQGDTLVVSGSPKALEELVGALRLKHTTSQKDEGVIGTDVSMMEVVVPQASRIEGRSALDIRLLYRHGVTLLGVSRQGKRFRERVRELSIQAGDILLLYGPTERLTEVADWLGALPLAERGLQVLQRQKAWIAVSAFAAAIIAASVGVIDLTVALGFTVVVLTATNIVPPRQVYESIEWPVIILLASLIPLGIALERSGGTALIAQNMLALAGDGSPTLVLLLLMIATMTLSDVLNNTATAVVTAPIALDLATKMNVSPDPFLMAVAIAASCAFLTPIGHKNNTLILGPGGYQFGDYWRMGLPLEIIVIAVSVPMILIVWPF